MAMHPTPHDSFFRALMANPKVRDEFLQRHLPSTVSNILRFETLSQCDGDFVNDDLKHYICDMVFKANIVGREGYLYILVEHQSRPEKLMPFRVLEYELQMMKRGINTLLPQPLPLVCTIVLYQGRSHRYGYGTDLLSLINAPGAVAKQIFTNNFTLVDLNKVPDQELQQYPWSGMLEYVLKKIDDKDLTYLDELAVFFNNPELAQHEDLLRKTFTYIFEAGKIDNKKKVLQALSEKITDAGLKEKIMTLAKIFRQEGFEKGMEKGLEQGVEQGQIRAREQVAIELLENNCEVAFIAKITHFSIEKIQQLAESLKIESHSG